MKINSEDFAKTLATAAVCFKHDLTEEVLQVYWTQFQSWEQETFDGAVQCCITTLQYFPSVHDIKTFFPIAPDPPTVPFSSGLTRIGTDADTGTPELESQVDSVDDREIFIFMEQAGFTEEAIKILIARFRKTPHSVLWRGIVKDVLCPSWDEDSSPRYRCLECFDLGVIEVYRGSYETGSPNTCYAACTCDAGKLHQRPVEPAHRGRCQPLPTFDDERMCRCSATDDAQRQKEWDEWKSRPRTETKFTEFDEWKGTN